MSVQVHSQENLSLFWDFETTCSASASDTISTYDLVKNIRAAASPFGPIKVFRAYADFCGQTLPRSTNIRSELSSSGVTLVDCPCNGRKELSAKIILVDILIHAWDHKAPHTFVIITADRDLAYAISLLRTRDYRVVVICPAITHPDLVAQASVQLDWSRVILGIHGGVVDDDDFLGHPTATKEPPPPPFSRNPLQETHNATHFTSESRKLALSDLGHTQGDRTRDPPPVELHNIPLRGRRNSIFSTHYDPHKFNVFGFNNEFATPKSRGSVNLGDGPLFPRPRSQAGEQSRADSAPPNIQYTTNLSTTHPSSTDNCTGTGFVLSSLKGKQKEPQKFDHFEPDDVVLEESPSHIPYSGSIFEPFGESGTQFQAMSASPRPAGKAPSTRTSSFSSSSTDSSRPSNFSIVYHAELSTAPTSAEPASATGKSDITVKPTTTTHTGLKTRDAEIPMTPSRRNSDTAAAGTQSNLANFDAISSAKEPIKETETVNLPVAQPAPAPLPSTLHTAPTAVSSAPLKAPVANPKSVAPAPASSSTLPNPAPIAKLPAVPSQAIPPKAPLARPMPRSNTTPAPVASTSTANPAVPPEFSLLVETLRREQHDRFANGVTKTVLGAALVKKSPNVYKKAGCSKFGTYIAAAVTAGIVRDVVIRDVVNNRTDQCVALQPKYA